MVRKMHKNMKGFTIIEVIVVLVIIGIAASFIVPRLMQGGDVKDAKIIQDHILDIYAAARSVKGVSPNYTTVTMTRIVQTSEVPWTSVATALSPLGGAYNVAANGVGINVTTAGVPSNICNTILNRFTGMANITAGCAGTTLTVTFAR